MKNKLYFFLIIFAFFYTNSVKAKKIDNDLRKTKITLSLENETFLNTLLKIELLTNYSFLYESKIINPNKKVSIKVKNKPLKFILNTLFKDENICFKLIGTNITLKRSAKAINKNYEIKGKVINAITKAAIPYCNIINKSNGTGTSTNENGEFILKVNSLPVSLTFSHLSFNTKLVEVLNNNEVNILLNPKKNVLDEVSLSETDEKKLIRYAKKAYLKIKKQAIIKKYAKAFYRQKTKNDKGYYEFSEIFFDLEYTNEGIENWKISEGRYALKDENLNNKNFTLFTKILKTLQPNTDEIIFPLHHALDIYYNLRLIEIIKSKDQKIAVILFKPRKNIKTPIFEGEIYLDLNSYDILKVIGEIKNDDLKFIKLSSNKGYKKNYSLSYEISFNKTDFNKTVLNYIKVNQKFDYLKNNNLVNTISSSSILTVYEHNKSKSNSQNSKRFYNNKGDWNQLDGIKYNETFWKDNPIVKRTPVEEKVISDLEKDYAFNNLFLNSRQQISLTQNSLSKTPYIKELNEKTRSFNKENIYEKLYLKTNKDVFYPNETIFFSSYLTHGSNHILTNSSNVLYVELISPENNKILSSQNYIFNGRGKNTLMIPSHINNGYYQLRAYTNWMKNFDQGYFYKKNIKIIGSKKKVINNNNKTKYNITFFPEGGHLIENKNNRIAFRLNNYQNSKKELKGKIIDSNGAQIKNVITKYNGIGYFNLEPKIDEKYRLILEDKSEYALPKSKKEGYTFFVNNLNDDFIKVKISASKNLIDKPFYLFGHMYRDRYIQGKFSFGKRSFIDIEFPKKNIPTGLLTLTILDENKTPWAERAIFINNGKTLSINVKNKIQKIGNVKKVTLKVNAKNYNSKPVIADLSIAVINKNLISKNDNSSNIVSYLLLESELKEQIKEPYLFIKDKSRPTKAKVDLIMLTNGWRSYNWKEIKSGNFSSKKFKREKGLTINGVAKNFNSSLLRNISIRAIVKSKNNLKIHKTKTDGNGNFKIENFNHFGDTELTFEGIINNKKTNQIRVTIDSINNTPLYKSSQDSNNIESYKYIISEKEKIEIVNNNISNFDNTFNELDEVVVQGNNKTRRKQSKSINNVVPNHTIYTEDIKGAVSVFDVLNRAPGVKLHGSIITMGPTNTDPLILLDGTVIFGGKGGKRMGSNLAFKDRPHDDPHHPLRQINLDNIERVEILKGNNATIFGSRGLGGVILLYSKRGNISNSKKDKSPLSQFTIKGYSLNKEFPASDYRDIKSYKNNSNSTISWNPNVQTDKNGNATITFFTIDENINYQVIIDALSNKGIPGFFIKDFKVDQ